MKKSALILAALALAFSLVSCEKKAEVVSGQDLPKPAPEKKADPQFPQAHALRIDTGFYDITDGKAKWKSSFPLGEKLAFLNEVVKAKYDTTEYEFAKVNYDGDKTGYVLATQIATNGELAVVTGTAANVYKSAKNVDVTGTILPRMSVIVIFPSTAKDNFMSFTSYDPVNKAYHKEKFLKTSEFSTSEADVQSAILLHTAVASKDETKKKALIQTAASEYSTSAFGAEILALSGNAPPKTIRSTVASGMINDDKVNLRDQPDEISGAVIDQLANGTAISVIEETVDTYTVGDKTDRWYRLSQPKDGWVFGAFVTLQ